MADISVAFEMATGTTDSISFKFETRHRSQENSTDFSTEKSGYRDRGTFHQDATPKVGNETSAGNSDGRARELAARLSIEEQVRAYPLS